MMLLSFTPSQDPPTLTGLCPLARYSYEPFALPLNSTGCLSAPNLKSHSSWPPPSHGLDYMSEACRKSNADRRCWENMGSFKPSEGICNLSREGGTGDGSKMLCLGGGNKRVGYGPTVLDQSGCIIYSVGSNMNFKFEEAMHRRSKCEIHTFDCTVKSDAKSKSGYLLSHSRRFYFHHICIGDPSLVTLHNHDGTFQGSLKSLGTIMQQLGHDKVDLLKMDIEDSEYAVFRDMFASFEDARLGVGPSSGMHLGFPLQLSFELHIGDYAQAFDPTNEKVLRGIPEIVELERMLRSMGYISVGFEPNVQVPRGGFGAEITMVRAMC